MSIEHDVRAYILDNFLFTDDDSALQNQESLLDRGIIDSTGVMELVAFLEEEFGIGVADDELLPDNLDSIQQIVGFVSRKQRIAANA
ncbi:acyl carrier protein [Thiohalomonas denitrificans]|uniref:Acyl carrier protein n=1 Tax=Thiohalomonas denitrificans TaxID=415747 RepID=A0A1G5Q2X5_9GAMM|nr:acyl carrier protein [Thiohalomonas denitrificans]SCZ55978.1 acyl carrier protein [Thiohalomonas denitrificans]